jgi:hypothetical protein
MAPAKKVAKRVAKPYEIIPPDMIQIVSYSELDTFRQCPLKHHLAYGRRWTKPPKPGGALDKGSLWHGCMEDHYGVIKKHQDATSKSRIAKSRHAEVLDEAQKLVDSRLYNMKTGEFLSETHELIAWMYDGYVQYYGIDDDWRIVAIEHQIVLPLPDENGHDSRYHIKMKLDLIIRERWSGHLRVVDHKSGQNLPNYMDLEIDDQFGLYTWGMNKIGKKVIGSVHSAARTTRNKGDWPNPGPNTKAQSLEQRMSRTLMNRDAKELDNLALDAYYAARAAYPDDPANAARYSSPDPRNCGWKCDFKEQHLQMRRGMNPDQVMIDAGFTVNRTRH